MHPSGFFEGIVQTDLQIDEHVFKVPALYRDGEQMTGIFPARLGKLRKLMPDPRISPARLAPGVGAVTVTCFEYRDTDLAPYNELAIGIPLNEPYFRSNFPGMAMLSAVRRGQFDTWVHHLPVTTEIARFGGVEFYNYPKFNSSIDFEQTDKRRSCRLAEGAEHILTLDCARIKGSGSQDIQIFSHLYQNREPQTSEFKIRAHKMGRSLKPGAAVLELGDRHPIATELNSLLISKRSIAAAYSPKIEGILYGPHHLTPEVLDKIIDIKALQSGQVHA
jgi:hypothetical protein